MTNEAQSNATGAGAYNANISRYYAYMFVEGFQLWLPIWVAYLQQMRGLTLTQITLLDAPFWIAIILAEVPTGAVADRWGRKHSLILGSLSFSLAIFLFGVGTEFWILLASYLVWAVSMALQSGADTAFLYDSLAAMGRESEFRKVTGRANAINIVGNLIGSLIGAPLAAATNLAVPILVSAALTLGAAAVLLTVREPARRLDAPRLPYFQVMREAAAFMRHHPTLPAMVALRAALMGAGMAGFIFTQPFLALYDVPLESYGLLSIPARLASIGAALIAYRLVAPVGERRLFMLLAVGFVASYAVLGMVDSVWAFPIFGALAACNSLTRPLSADYITRHSPQHMRATLMSMAQMAMSVTLLAAEPGMGALADRTSLQTTFLAAAVGVGVIAALALAAWTAAERTQRKRATLAEAAGVR